MKNAQLRIIFILTTLCTIGIISAQIYGVRRAYIHENERFDLNVSVSLRDVAFKVWQLQQSQSTIYNVVNRLSNDYYLVKINENVEESDLEHFLKESFTKNGVYADFVFGLHDCLNNKFKYEKFINMSNKQRTPTGFHEFPEPRIDNYYFVVYFPYRSGYLANQLTIWVVSSLLILCTLAVLSYVIYVMLNQKRLSEMQKDFVKNMTHEFKTPLTSIQLASTVLKKPNIIENPTRLLNYASIIETEARKLEIQVERVLQMSMGQKRALQLNKTCLDVGKLIKEAAEAYQTLLENREGSLKIITGNSPAIVWGDADHLKTAFSNLIDNAIKYTPEEQAPHIKIHVRDAYKNEFHIDFSDTGIGISKKDQKLIFQRFFRVPTGNIHNIKGFGIGLNYVKSIISLHGGKIMCESEEGKGTTFTIVLPKPKDK
jgi:two-component system phosphate regulon sensor histidine kinase PhoR